MDEIKESTLEPCELEKVSAFPLLCSQRGMLLVIATVCYGAVFSVALIAAGLAPDPDKIFQFVGGPLSLFGGILVLGYGYYFKDKNQEHVADAGA